MKRDMLVAMLFCIALAVFCLWYINYQVVSSSTKDILKMCVFGSAFLGGFALGEYLWGDK